MKKYSHLQFPCDQCEYVRCNVKVFSHHLYFKGSRSKFKLFNWNSWFPWQSNHYGLPFYLSIYLNCLSDVLYIRFSKAAGSNVKKGSSYKNNKHLDFYGFPGSLQRYTAGSDIKKGSTYKNIKHLAFYDFPGSLQRRAAGSDIKKE